MQKPGDPGNISAVRDGENVAVSFEAPANPDNVIIKGYKVTALADDGIRVRASISRLGRSTRDLLNIIDVLQRKGVTLVSAKENIDTDTQQGRFVLSIFAALSELEREQTLQRQREGIAIAKAQGKYKGRQPQPIDWIKFGQLYEQWKAGAITAVWFQKEMGLRANTFYRRLKEYERK
ncbi:recombinase family protein [Ruminococcus flavefaciens]|uniref:recombinase family protein n=1 Tax=Ruminococcus flavefaciens TaxID=1265 RepID=UPI00036E77FA|nr:recombinase family protein [Ruminococcus flavefaciens]